MSATPGAQPEVVATLLDQSVRRMVEAAAARRRAEGVCPLDENGVACKSAGKPRCWKHRFRGAVRRASRPKPPPPPPPPLVCARCHEVIADPGVFGPARHPCCGRAVHGRCVEGACTACPRVARRLPVASGWAACEADLRARFGDAWPPWCPAGFVFRDEYLRCLTRCV